MVLVEEENKKMIEALIRQGKLKDRKVAEAMLKTPRVYFVWKGYEDLAYEDQPLPLGDTGQTISAPHMVAIMLEQLEVKKGHTVLEVGTGSGYNAACLSYLVGEEGKVVSIEINRILHEFAKNNLSKLGIRNVELILGNGTLGYPERLEQEIYDRIIVTAAADEIPGYLVTQLRQEGIMVLPLGKGFTQLLTKLKKKDRGIETKEICEVIFVPLRNG